MASLRQILANSILRLSQEPLNTKWNRAPYFCTQCGKAIKKRNICAHLLSHVHSKVQHCDSCSFGFSTESFLRKHLAKHVEEILRQPRGTKRPSNLRKSVKRTKFYQAREWTTDYGSETEVDLPGRRCKKRSSYNEEEVQQWDALTVDEPKLLVQNDPLKCVVCERVFSSSAEVTRHMVVHPSSELPFKCALCAMRFGTRDALADHMPVHASETCEKCDMCDKSYASKSALKRHKLQSHKVRHRCHSCKKYFHSEKGLKIHSKVSKCKRIPTVAAYTCVQCNEAFESADLLSKHVVIHKPPEEGLIEECLVCGEGFNTKTELGKHLSTHSLRLPPSIDLTADGLVLPQGNKVASEAGFSKDTSVRNGNTDMVIDLTDDAPAVVSAGANSLNFQVPFEEKPQMDVSKGDGPHKPFVCIVCGKSFTRNFKLVEHMMLHTGERPYSCPECGKGFRAKHRLSEHMMEHSGERPYKCHICNAGFKVNHLFVKHMSSHDGEKPYKCTKCGESFAVNRELSAHMATHNGYVPIRCSICGEGITSNEDIAAHMATHKQQIPNTGSKEGFNVTAHSREMPYNGTGVMVGLNLNQGIVIDAAERPPELPYSARGAVAPEILYNARGSVAPEILYNARGAVAPEIPYNARGAVAPEIPYNARGAVAPEIPYNARDAMAPEIPYNARGAMAPEIPYNARGAVPGFDLNQGIPGTTTAHAPEMPYSARGVVPGLNSNQGITNGAAMPYFCVMCGECFGSDLQFSAHMAMHGEEMLRKGDSAVIDQKLAEPVATPSEEKVFECFVCGEDFFSDAELSVHMKKDHAEMAYKSIDLTPDDSKMLQKTEENFSVPRNCKGRPYTCTICGDSFSASAKFELHVQQHTGIKPFKCTQCDKSFFLNKQLIKHMQTHNAVKPYKCSECEKMFTSTYKLKEHMMVHTDERPFSCTICGNAYRTNRYLTKHMLKHNQGLAYQCTQCGEGFQERQRLRDHLVQHSGVVDAAYDCRVCGKGYLRGVDLANHMTSHNNAEIKPFSCIVCGKEFAKEQFLISHVKYKHTVSTAMEPP